MTFHGRKESLLSPSIAGRCPIPSWNRNCSVTSAGAFTNANKDKPGLFAAAEGGTILLDEIGDTSSAFQVRLLRVLEEREFQPLGGVEKIKTDTRIIAATNRDLAAMVGKPANFAAIFIIVSISSVFTCRRSENGWRTSLSYVIDSLKR